MAIPAFRTRLLVLTQTVVTTRRTLTLFKAQAAANCVCKHAEKEDDKDVDGGVSKQAKRDRPKRKYDWIARNGRKTCPEIQTARHGGDRAPFVKLCR